MPLLDSGPVGDEDLWCHHRHPSPPSTFEVISAPSQVLPAQFQILPAPPKTHPAPFQALPQAFLSFLTYILLFKSTNYALRSNVVLQYAVPRKVIVGYVKLCESILSEDTKRLALLSAGVSVQHAASLHNGFLPLLIQRFSIVIYVFLVGIQFQRLCKETSSQKVVIALGTWVLLVFGIWLLISFFDAKMGPYK